MADNRRNILRSSVGISAATLLSRLLGLLRVILEARVLGGGALASTWQLAFMVPNLFRRLLGEGALGTALIPLIAHLEEAEGIRKVKKELAVVFLTLGILLALISVAVSGGALLLQNYFEQPYIKDALALLPLLMPYTIFICLIGIMTGVVNTKRIFFLPALGGLLLNIFLIGVLWYFDGHASEASATEKLHALSWTVLGAGAAHLILMLALMLMYGLFPVFEWKNWRESRIFRDLFTLALPGLIGGGASQFSFLVDRSLAAFIGSYAVPALNYTERLVYLPIGIFAMALGSVLMADMSRAAARRDYAEMLDDMELGLRYVWYFCAPLATFLIVCRLPLVELLFQHGNFTEEHAKETAYALLFYSLGIPAFCAIKVILPAFYARKEMKTPLKVSLLVIALNLILSISLMGPLRQGGIALATVITSQLNNVALLYLLTRQGYVFSMRNVIATAAKALIGSALAALAVWITYPWFCDWFGAHIKSLPPALPALLTVGLLFALIYLGSSLLLRCGEPQEMLESLRKKRAPNQK